MVAALSMLAIVAGCGKHQVVSTDASTELAPDVDGASLGLPERAPALLADPPSSPAPAPARATGCTAGLPCARRVSCDAARCPREPAWAIEELALGGTFACARYANGGVWCAGTEVAAVAGVKNVSRLVAGSGSHACVLSEGAVLCWGVGESGQLGNGRLESTATPERVRGLADATIIAAGNSHSCAATKTGGVMCWGKNDEGQLGDGTKENRVEPVAVKGVTKVKALALGFRQSCAVKADGGIVCWGRQGGPKGEPRTIAGLALVDELTAMRTDTCARSARTVSCFGTIFGREPSAIPELSSSTHIASDGYDVCGLRSGGRVTCFNAARRESYELDQGAGSPGAKLLAGGTCVIRSDDAVACTKLSVMASKLEQL
jgi:Regulator of chromosome condensation (RCC1) repeat